MPTSPWLALVDKPPAEGAFGWVTNIHAPIYLQWVRDQKVEAIDPDGLFPYKWTEGGLPDRGADIAIFDVVNGVSLVWGSKGWAWILPGQPGAHTDLVPDGMSPVEGNARNDFNLSQAAQASNSDGYSFVVGEILKMNRDLKIYASPDPSANVLGMIPARWPRKTALWRKPWSDWQSLSSAPALPALANARFISSQDVVPSSSSLVPDAENTLPTILRIQVLQGDWAKVFVPEQGTPIINIDNDRNAPDGNPGLLIHWRRSPAGWIRWAEPGPVAGTRICVVDLGWVGVVD